MRRDDKFTIYVYSANGLVKKAKVTESNFHIFCFIDSWNSLVFERMPANSPFDEKSGRVD